MKPLNEFLIDKAGTNAKIIKNLDDVFNSHDFIRKFSKRFEKEYVGYLTAYSAKKNKGIFRTVHGIIAKHLSKNSSLYKIKKNGKVISQNIFGDKEQIQNWKRT